MSVARRSASWLFQTTGKLDCVKSGLHDYSSGSFHTDHFLRNTDRYTRIATNLRLANSSPIIATDPLLLPLSNSIPETPCGCGRKERASEDVYPHKSRKPLNKDLLHLNCYLFFIRMSTLTTSSFHHFCQYCSILSIFPNSNTITT